MIRPAHTRMKEAIAVAQSSLSLPADSYIYDVRPGRSILAAICSDDSLRVFDPSTLQPILDQTVCNTHEGVTCLAEYNGSHSAFFTAGRDGMVKAWDQGSGRKVLEVKIGIISTSKPNSVRKTGLRIPFHARRSSTFAVIGNQSYWTHDCGRDRIHASASSRASVVGVKASHSIQVSADSCAGTVEPRENLWSDMWNVTATT